MSKKVGLAMLLIAMSGIAAASIPSAPEIDPASAMAGLTMLAGGLAILRGRRSRK